MQPARDNSWVDSRVIRLINSLGRRLVNLLPVAQRTNTLTNGVVDIPWVVGREFESHTSTMKTLFKEKRFSSCQESDITLSLGPQGSGGTVQSDR